MHILGSFDTSPVGQCVIYPFNDTYIHVTFIPSSAISSHRQGSQISEKNLGMTLGCCAPHFL